MTRTAPDVTFAGEQIAQGAQWRVLKDAGSDHRPVAVDIPFYDPEQVPKRRERWAVRKADWEAYRRETERELGEERGERGVEEMAQKLERVLLAAGTRTVPRGRGRRQPKPWWTEEIEQAVQERQRLEETQDGTWEGRLRLEAVKEELKKRIEEEIVTL